MTDTATNRPPALRQLEARAAKAQKNRTAAWERVCKARAHLYAAMDAFDDCLAHETASFQALCHARQAAAGNGPAPAPPADDAQLPGIEEED